MTDNARSGNGRGDLPAAGIDRLSYDVVVIGAGGSGLRAAIEARLAGKRTAVISKSLFGKAHTVMAEGGCRRRDGQREPEGQLAGPFPRHHARRQVPEQLADGRTARPGGARPGLGTRGLGRAVRPHPRREDQPAQLRRARVPAAGARGRPDRPGDDPHPAAEDGRAAAGGRPRARRPGGHDQGFRRDHDHPAAQGRRADRRRVRLRPGDRAVRAVRGAGRHPGHRRDRQDVQGDLELLGVHRGRARAGAAGRRDPAEHGVRAVPPHAHGVAAVGGRAAGHRVGSR